MEHKNDRVYPSAPVENNDSEQRLEKNLNVVNSSKNHIGYIKEMITYFKDKNNKSKKKYKKYKMLTTKIKSLDAVVIIAETSSSTVLYHTRIRLIVIPRTTGLVCGLSISKKVRYEILRQIYNKYVKQFEKDQKTNKSFVTLCRKSFQDKLNDKNDYESLCNIFTKNLDKTKNKFFL